MNEHRERVTMGRRGEILFPATLQTATNAHLQEVIRVLLVNFCCAWFGGRWLFCCLGVRGASFRHGRGPQCVTRLSCGLCRPQGRWVHTTGSTQPLPGRGLVAHRYVARLLCVYIHVTVELLLLAYRH